MNSPQLFKNIVNNVAIDSIVPPDGGNDDYMRQEFQYTKWKGYPFVTNPDVVGRLNLNENDERVRIFDTEKIYDGEELLGELQLVHFLPAENTMIPDKDVDFCRGLIFFVPEDKDAPAKLVARSYPHTPEFIYIENKSSEVDQKITDFEPVSATVAHEGTILRLFNFQGKWRFSTHRRINGLKSRWTGEAFGKILARVAPELDTSVLNENYCYVLLLEDQYTGLVCSGVEGGQFVPHLYIRHYNK